MSITPEPANVTVPTRGERLLTPLEQRLFKESYRFNFFQAARTFERLYPDKNLIGRGGEPTAEAVRFGANVSLSFPTHHVAQILPPTNEDDIPQMLVNFLGLTGPSGVLPTHYTELIMRLERIDQDTESRALRDWLDLFNHRMIGLFHWAWEKYRVFFPFERGSAQGFEPGTFGGAILCLIGIGTEGLRNRLYVPGHTPEAPRIGIDDIALVRFAGLLAHHPRNATILESISHQLFGVPVRVQQFQGDWLVLEPPNQSRLGLRNGNNALGKNVVVGERVWSIENKIRIRIGPLSLKTFTEYLPDESSDGAKSFFAFCKFVRFYIGPHLDFDLQLVIDRDEVPRSQLEGEGFQGTQLGWNSWLAGPDYADHPDDAVFESCTE